MDGSVWVCEVQNTLKFPSKPANECSRGQNVQASKSRFLPRGKGCESIKNKSCVGNSSRQQKQELLTLQLRKLKILVFNTFIHYLFKQITELDDHWRFFSLFVTSRESSSRLWKWRILDLDFCHSDFMKSQTNCFLLDWRILCVVADAENAVQNVRWIGWHSYWKVRSEPWRLLDCSFLQNDNLRRKMLTSNTTVSS